MKVASSSLSHCSGYQMKTRDKSTLVIWVTSLQSWIFICRISWRTHHQNMGAMVETWKSQSRMIVLLASLVDGWIGYLMGCLELGEQMIPINFPVSFRTMLLKYAYSLSNRILSTIHGLCNIDVKLHMHVLNTTESLGSLSVGHIRGNKISSCSCSAWGFCYYWWSLLFFNKDQHFWNSLPASEHVCAVYFWYSSDKLL